MVLPAIPVIVGAGVWGYRLFQGYRAVRAAQTVAAAGRAAQVAAAAARAQRAAALAKAAQQAQTLSQSKAREEPCDDCGDPCAHLACGKPGSKYRGGAHGCVGLPANKPRRDGSIHSHHMPADKYSPLPRPAGPAIQMEDTDHRQTASYGSRVHGPPYSKQRSDLQAGHTMDAIYLDIVDARRVAAQAGDPTRYDEAIGQMMAYARCPEEQGPIQ